MKKALLLAVFTAVLWGTSMAQSPTQNKVGGVCWRVDDHQGAAKWRDWNATFNKYGLKYSLAINASRLFTDTAAVNALKEAVASGHELMDHTPDHHMGYFTVKALADTTAFSGNATVDHINGTKVCLKVDAPYTESFVGEGTVNLIGNKLISTANGEFLNINGNPYYALVYIPSKNQYAVYTSVQNKISSDPDTLVLQTYWGETWKNDTAYGISYHKITTADVKTNPQSNLLLAQRSIQLFASFGLPAPKTWIQPGGSYGLLNRAEVKAFGDIVGYTAGAENILSAQKCYNEVDTFANRRFSLQGPDFYEETNNYQGLINIMSDRSARHYNSFGLSHMNNVTGGWSVFLGRVDSVLNWSNINTIPTRTYNQWASILFDSSTNQAANVLPALNKDLNNNNFPDGYNTTATFDMTDGVAASGNKCFVASANNSTLASISNLGGLEKGNNLVSIYTKGQTGDSIRMIITYPEMSLPTQLIMFGAGTSSWTLQSKIITIPANITRINVSWVVIKRTVAGPVKMSGLEMRKSSVPVLNKGYLQNKKATQKYGMLNLNNFCTDGYFAQSALTFSIGNANTLNAQFNSLTHELLVQPNRAFFVGTDSIRISVSNPDGMSDTAWFKFASEAYSINYGDTLNAQVVIEPTPTSSSLTSNPTDASAIISLPNFTAIPKVSTWYTLNATQTSATFLDSFFVSVIGSAPIDTTHTDTTLVIDTTQAPTYTSTAFTNKVGGVSFRVDDQQSATNYRALNATFNKYGKKLTLGINASKLIGDTAAVNALKELAAAGHELADHTPDHTMAFFNVNLVQDTNAYRGNAGVDHFNGKKVCLKIDSVITTNYTLEGLVNVNGSTLISQANGEWKDMGAPVYYSNIYLPSVNKTYSYTNLLNKNQNDPDTLTLQSYWGETVNLSASSGIAYHRLTQYDIKQSVAGLQVLTNRTQYILDSLGLPRPKTFLQPSGNYAMMNRSEVKDFYGTLYGYTAGGVYTSSSLRCYNEVDANHDKRFGMHAQDFKEETNSAASIITSISDNSAKHQQSFGFSMMAGMTGGLTGYTARVDSILNFCVANELPVLTFNKWANMLYDSVPNPFVNVMPLLQKDLTKNTIPDGFTGPFSVFDTTDGVAFSNNRSYSRNSNGIMTAIQNLGGIEKGNNLVVLSTKGFTGDSIRIGISYPELGSTVTNVMVAASSANFTEYSFTLNIPSNVSRVNFSFNAVKRNVAGNIKLSGLKMFAMANKSSIVEAKEIQTAKQKSTEATLEVYPNPFENKITLVANNIKAIQVYDLTGKEIAFESSLDEEKANIELASEMKGIYLLKVETEDGKTLTKKIVKN
ncbi:MAG: hypothetical protein CFE21_10080 [Bacteroidetes bacterium B1(2017)]|nr:MAG: hypothetical protein CFE21_10080 [Bacteroidetes bacterium B1(2017)]